MGKGTPSFLSTKWLAMLLFKVAAVLFFILALHWFAGMRPPAPYMYWSFVLAWAFFFITNLLVSIFTWHYSCKGNLVFHIALVIVAVGVAVSVATRFSGGVLLMEGDTFFGEESEYDSYETGIAFDRTAPRVSFKVTSIEPEYWKDELYFTGLDARIKYPAETMASEGVVRLNGGVSIDGTRVRLTAFGFFPDLVVKEKGRPTLRGALNIGVFPPGTEGEVEVRGYELFMTVLSDPSDSILADGIAVGGLKNRSMNITDPILKLKVRWLGEDLYHGYLKADDTVRFGDFTLEFRGLKKWAVFGVVRDPGEAIIFAGFALALAGLAWRLFTGWRGGDGKAVTVNDE